MVDYDFYITPAVGDSLGFNTNITPDNPYERATAQFRKDQLDSTPRVGDQSLTGWWTRGQLSFHKGAGVTYYEVLESDTVLDRYLDSDSVAVFEPGEVTLLPSLTDLALASIDGVPAPLSAGGGIYALTTTGVQYTAGSTATAIATSNAAVPTSITSNGSRYYVTNGTKIEQQFNPSEARTNHVTNPSFETATTGWSGPGLGSASIARDSTQAKYGTYSLLVHPDATFGGSCSITVSGLSIGQIYKVSVWVYVVTAFGQANPVVLQFGGSTLDTSTTHDGWEQLTGTFTATATSHVLQAATSGGSGHPTFYFDSALVAESPYTGDYFDGTQPGCAWVGTPHASKSTFATSSNGASTVLITLTGATWKKVWWAKGRLWAVDSAGYWYALAALTATVSNTASFWNSGRTDVTWSLAEGTGSVYISDGHDIYAVTVNTDGLVPSLATPTTASRVPLGEEIACIAYYLGQIVVSTTRGVRLAAVQSDGGLLLGPLVIQGDFSAANRVGLYDTRAYVAGRPEDRGGSTVLCAIDLSQAVTDFVYAWSPQFTITILASTASGAVVDATGRLYSWGGGTTLVASRDELSASGYLTTAYHRYGTLEPKHFDSVLVRTSGEGGTVAVSRVDADGTVTLLTTISVPATVTEVDLDLSDVAERVALKFTLTRSATDATKGPTLLGYQLRALPVPKRQRMIRVPLMLFDKEQTRNGQTVVADSFARLSALEALEESNAVVTFNDKETGETGPAFIESVEVTRKTPAARGPGGFGGVVFVTLRKI